MIAKIITKSRNHRAAIVWFVASLFYLYEYFVRVIPSVMEREIESAFEVGASEFGLAVGLYYFIYSPMQLIVGGLFDYYGGRRLIIPACFLVSMGCFFAIIPSNGLFMLGIGRLLMGFGSAFGFVGVMYLCTIWFKRNQLAMLSGLTTTLGMFGAIVGQGPISKIVDNYGWKQTWVFAGILGLVLTVILSTFIPKKDRSKARESESARMGVIHNFTKSLTCVLKNPQIWIVGIIGGILFLPLSVLADLWGIQYIRTLTNASKMESAKTIAMLYLGWLVSSPIAGILSDKLKTRRKPLIVSCIGCFVLLIYLLSLNKASLGQLSLIFFFLGVISSAQVVIFIVGVEDTPQFAHGSAIALVNMIVMILGATLQPVVGIILDFVTDAKMISGIVNYTQKDYRLALAILPILAFFGTILSFFLKESYHKNR